MRLSADNGLVYTQRTKLFNVSNGAYDALLAAKKSSQVHVELWRDFQEYLLETSIRDCERAIELAINSQSLRMLSESVAWLVQLRFLSIKHGSRVARHGSPAIRQEAMDLVKEACQEALDESEENLSRMAALAEPARQPSEQPDEDVSKVRQKQFALIGAVEALIRQLEKDTWHGVITDEETAMVMKTFFRAEGFSASEHAYRKLPIAGCKSDQH